MAILEAVKSIKKPPRPKHEKPKLYDRTVAGVPDAYTVIVDDPYEHGAKQTMTASLRDDPLGRLFIRNQIDKAQFDAGRDMQGLYERAQIGGVKAMDPTKEPVDGGGAIPEMIGDIQMRAVKRIAQLEKTLGNEGTALIRQFLACRMFVDQIAEQRGLTSQRDKDYLGKRIRECLETLAIELGHAGRVISITGG